MSKQAVIARNIKNSNRNAVREEGKPQSVPYEGM